MMRPEVYERIYRTAKGATGAAVEIGTGHGAGAVCMALAGLRVYTFDKFEGGSRKAYGDGEKNLCITRAAMETFGVADRVKIVPGDVAETWAAAPNEIGMLFLDCDGRIDRDLGNLMARVPEGAPIIIDDMADRARATDKGTHLRIDQKHRITYLLTQSALDYGILTGGEMVNQTWFGARGDGSEWPAEAVLDCYRQLVFGNAEKPR